MKLINTGTKIINIGDKILMPGETMPIDKELAYTPAIRAFAEKGLLSIDDSDDKFREAVEAEAKRIAFEEEAKRIAAEEAAKKAAAEEAARKAAEEAAAKKAAEEKAKAEAAAKAKAEAEAKAKAEAEAKAKAEAAKKAAEQEEEAQHGEGDLEALAVQKRLERPDGAGGHGPGAGVAVQPRDAGVFQAASIDFPVQKTEGIPVGHDGKQQLHQQSKSFHGSPDPNTFQADHHCLFPYHSKLSPRGSDCKESRPSQQSQHPGTRFIILPEVHG